MTIETDLFGKFGCHFFNPDCPVCQPDDSLISAGRHGALA